jgi:hypothetical protein
MHHNKFMKYVYSATILGIVLALSFLVTSNTLSSFGSTNSSIAIGNTTNTNTTSTNPVVKNLDDAISSLKSNDNAAAKTDLRNAEKEMEADPSLQLGEKHVEASLAALKDGDTKSAIDHAQQALDATNQK